MVIAVLYFGGLIRVMILMKFSLSFIAAVRIVVYSRLAEVKRRFLQTEEFVPGVMSTKSVCSEKMETKAE